MTAEHEHAASESASGEPTRLSAGVQREAARAPGASRSIPSALDAFAEERPGDPACLLRRVCQACGSVADQDPPATCPQCGSELPAS